MSHLFRVVLALCASVYSTFLVVGAGAHSRPTDVAVRAAASTPGAAMPSIVYTKTALTGGRAGETGVWEMRADGANPHQLFAFANPGAAAMSRAGSELAIAPAESDDIWIVTLAGTVLRHFIVPDPTGHGVVSLSWSPRGDELAYCVVGSSGALVAYTVSANGTDPAELGTPGGNPSWSPSGTAVVVDNVGWYSGTTDGGLFVVVPGQPGARLVVSEPGSPGAPARPTWSPSGAQIAFAGRSGIEVVAPTGGTVTPLGVSGGAPVWSPDSTTLAYSTTLNDATVSIFTVGADGTGDRDVDPTNGNFEDTPIGFVPSPILGLPACTARLPGGVVAMAPTASGEGYVIADGQGDVVACGDAQFGGSLSGMVLSRPVIGVAADVRTGGYWLVSADGGVFSFDAPFWGSAARLRLRQAVVSLLPTPDDAGYWLVAADGGVFAYGDARFAGSAAGLDLHAPVVAAACGSTGTTGRSGTGYRLTSTDGGVFSFEEPFLGSAAAVPLRRPIVALVPGSAAGEGYRLVGADGGVFSFGAPFRGSAAALGLRQPIVAAAADPRTDGYWLLGADGGVFSFGAPFLGSAAR
jgi:hypothetical protein